MPSDDEIRQILNGPGTSYWLKNALTAALDRDPVDAVNDAELLVLVLRYRCDEIQSKAQTEIAIKRAQIRLME